MNINNLDTAGGRFTFSPFPFFHFNSTLSFHHQILLRRQKYLKNTHLCRHRAPGPVRCRFTGILADFQLKIALVATININRSHVTVEPRGG